MNQKKYKLQTNIKHNIQQITENNSPLIKPETISDKDILKKFFGIKQATSEEKTQFIKFKISNSTSQTNNINKKNTAIGLLILGIILIITIIFKIPVSPTIDSLRFTIIFTSFIFSFIIFISIKDSKKLINKIKNGNIYIANAYSYSHKKIKRPSILHYDYYIKITDKNGHYIDKWFLVPNIPYFDNKPHLLQTEFIIPDIKNSNHKEITGKIYLIAYKNEYIIEFIPEEEIKKIN